MIAFETHADGTVLPVRAQPGSRKSEIRGVQEGAIKVAVTQVAEKGKANRAIALLLSQRLGLRKSRLELLSGETSSQKRFLVRGVSSEDLQAAINAVVR